MKKATLRLTVLALLIVSSTKNQVKAQEADKINVVTSAVPFLRISPDARSGGMGDVGIATIADANAVFWNRAKIPFAPVKGGVSLTYTPWLKDLGLNDVYLATLGGYYQFDENQAISASLRYFSLGKIQFTDAYGVDLTLFNPKEFGFDVGYSLKLSPKSALGVALRYISSNLAGSQNISGQVYKPGRAVAGDLTYFHNGAKENGEGFAWGVTLTNLGSKISYTSDASQKDYIPANLGLGGSYTRVFDETSKLAFALDVNKLLVPTPPSFSTDAASGEPTPEDEAKLAKYHNQSVVSSWTSSFGDAPGGFSEELKEFQISLGAEYWYNNQFAFRAGYFYENPLKGNRKYFTLGAGLKYNMFGMNFSYLLPSGSGISRNPLSNTLRFSLMFDLGNNNSEESTTPDATTE